jgi:hypothetical protein
MQVKILICADENKFSAKLISGKHSKKIVGKPRKNSEIKTTLLGLIKTIKQIKYPVELNVINDSVKIKEVFDEGLEKSQHKSYVMNNMKEWKELASLIRQHEYFIFSLPEKEKDLREISELMRDCLYKRF